MEQQREAAEAVAAPVQGPQPGAASLVAGPQLESLPARVLALQRAAGNAAVARMARQLARACCSSCATGGRCEDELEDIESTIRSVGRAPSASRGTDQRFRTVGPALARAVRERQIARAPLCGTGIVRTCASGGSCDTPDSTAAADPNGPWLLTVAIDIETEKVEDVRAATVGHTYVEFKGADGKLWTYGFYPNPTTPPTEFKWDVYGCMVHPDTIHTACVDHRETFKVTPTQYQAALKFAQDLCKATPHYHLRDFNCTTFAKRVVEAAGQKLAESKGKVGGVLTTDNPNTLYDSIKDRDIPTRKLTGDTEMRDWLRNHSYEDIGRLPEGEKLRIINRLLNGWVSDDDLLAIEWVCKGVKDKAEMERIDKAIRPRANDLNWNRQKKRLGEILDIRP